MPLRSIEFNKFGALSHVPIKNQINFFKDCIQQVLFGPFLNTLSQIWQHKLTKKMKFFLFFSYVSNLFVILRNILKVKFFNDKTVFKEVLI